jgi:hypothetical protein
MRMYCPSCGFANMAASRQCEQCGDLLPLKESAAGRAAQASSRTSTLTADSDVRKQDIPLPLEPKRQPQRATVPTVQQAHRFSSSVQGCVSGFQQRTETNISGRPEQVWAFRVDVYDGSGDLVQRFPVEMRGISLSGIVRDGDIVEVDVRRGDGQLLMPKCIRNLSIGADVGERHPSRITQIVFAVLMLVVFIIVVVVSIGIYRGARRVNTEIRCFDQKSAVGRIENEYQFEMKVADMGGPPAAEARRRSQQLLQELGSARQALNACMAK